jgi:hypothetical protein
MHHNEGRNNSVTQDDSNNTLLSEKKFSKECVRCCVQQTGQMALIEVAENDTV